MTNDTDFNNEIYMLVAACDGTKRDALCEWAYAPQEYPTLCAYVRRGITSQEAILNRVAQLARV